LSDSIFPFLSFVTDSFFPSTFGELALFCVSLVELSTFSLSEELELPEPEELEASLVFDLEESFLDFDLEDSDFLEDCSDEEESDEEEDDSFPGIFPNVKCSPNDS